MGYPIPSSESSYSLGKTPVLRVCPIHQPQPDIGKSTPPPLVGRGSDWDRLQRLPRTSGGDLGLKQDLPGIAFNVDMIGERKTGDRLQQYVSIPSRGLIWIIWGHPHFRKLPYAYVE